MTSNELKKNMRVGDYVNIICYPRWGVGLPTIRRVYVAVLQKTQFKDEIGNAYKLSAIELCDDTKSVEVKAAYELRERAKAIRSRVMSNLTPEQVEAIEKILGVGK